MKKTAVSEYGYINAKLRTRAGSILTDDFRRSLLAAENLEEAMQVLGSSGFEEAAAVWDRTGDIQSVEFELYQRHLDNYRMVQKNTRGDIQSFVRLLSIKPEIENIKNTLRLWFGSKVKKRPIGHRAAYIYREKIFENIDWDALINAADAADIISILEGTVYGNSVKNLNESGKGLFRTETALDKLYYSSIMEKGSILKPSDFKLLKDIITVEIDLQNISWLIRYRHFYKMDFTELKDIIIPGGSRLQLESLVKAESSALKNINPADVLIKNYPELSALSISEGHNFSSQASMLEQLLDQTRKSKFMSLLGGYPFTIGIILVYFFLSEREYRFISSVINGKYYNIGTSELEGLV